MRQLTRTIGRWVLEFAAGVDAGNAIRHRAPVNRYARAGSTARPSTRRPGNPDRGKAGRRPAEAVHPIGRRPHLGRG